MSLDFSNAGLSSSSSDWDRPKVQEIGPAAWQTRVNAVVMAKTLKPLVFGVTMLGSAINRLNPEILQRNSLAAPDKVTAFLRPIKHTRIERVQLPGCRAEWVIAPNAGNAGDPTILYFHGGAFITCGLGTHRRMISHISRAARARVLSVDYRMLPLHTIHDSVEDGLDAYRHLLASGINPATVVFAGDSAGGFLAAMTALRVKEEGLPLPAGQVLISALTDSDMAPKLPPRRAYPDAMFPAATIKFINDVFVTKNGTDPETDSPVESDLAGLGPFLQQVGSREMLRHDAVRLAQRLDEDGVVNWLQIWDRAPHVFQIGADVNPDARQAIAEIGAFTRSVVAAATASVSEANVG